MPTPPLRVALVDDHEIVRQGLKALFESAPDMVVVGEAGTASAASAEIPALKPDVLVLDGRLPDGSGIEVCRDIRSADSSIRVLILTSYDDDEALFASIMAGASGYLLKQVKGIELLSAVRLVANGSSLVDATMKQRLLDRIHADETRAPELEQLTDQELRVLRYIADGLTNREIGVEMSLAEKTVKNYVTIILSKLGLTRRTQAAVLAVRLLDDSSA